MTDESTQWYATALTVLREASGDAEWARAEVEAVRTALGVDPDGRTDPRATFGTPQEFAADRMADRSPEIVDASARRRLVERSIGALGAVGGLGVVQSVRAAFVDGWDTTTELRSVVLVGGLVAAIVTAGAVPSLLRLMGRVRAATGVFVAGLALAPLTVAVVALMPTDGEQVRIPSATTAIVLVSLAVGLWALVVRPVARRAELEARQSAAGAYEAWFVRLAGLLRGRHDLDGRTAGALADQAREHWAAARADHPEGASPEAEFGDVTAYAADLAAGRRQQPPWWLRRGVWGAAGAAVLGAAAVTAVLDGSAAWEVAVRTALALLIGAGAIVDLRAGARQTQGVRPATGRR